MNTRIQEVCEAAAERWAVPAMAVGTTGGEVVALGCEPETRFRIASVTKPFTALLALELLAEEEQTGVWPSDVRVRHLLSHTTGFDCELREPDLQRFGQDDDALAAAVAELDSVTRLVGSDDVWSYANAGFWLAGHLLAARAESTFEDAVVGRILAPLGLEATAFGEPELDGTGESVQPGPYPRARRASGGLVSNVDDVVRFGRALLTRPAFARMALPHGKPIRGVYGFGLFGERVAGVDVWGHSGSWGGFESSFLVVPSRGAVFAGLTNASNGAKALYEVENAFLESAIGRRRSPSRFVDVPVAERASFAGTYANGEESYEVRVDGTGITVAAGGEEVHLLPTGPRTFEIPDGPHVRERVDFPRVDLARFGSRLARRAA